MKKSKIRKLIGIAKFIVGTVITMPFIAIIKCEEVIHTGIEFATVGVVMAGMKLIVDGCDEAGIRTKEELRKRHPLLKEIGLK